MKPRSRQPNYRVRLQVVAMVLVLATTGLIGKALAVQVLGKDFYQRQGDARHLRDVTIPAYRGMITDRNGEPLAVSTPVVSLWAIPGELLEIGGDRIPELANDLGIDAEQLTQRLVQRRDLQFVYIERHLDPEDAGQFVSRNVTLDLKGHVTHADESFIKLYGKNPESEPNAMLGFDLVAELQWPKDVPDPLTRMLKGKRKVYEGLVSLASRPGNWRVSIRPVLDQDRLVGAELTLSIPGVYQLTEFRRYYPAGEALAHVIGFTDIDDRGQEGLELAFEDWLGGKAGSKRVLQDRRGHRVEDIDLIAAAQPGKDLTLSIDRRIQYLAYRELKAAIAEHGASGGSVVVLDVPTGEVLAMVNQPSYNPNKRDRQRGGSVRNRAVTDVFEPGSTVKPFTVTAALESGKFDAHTMVDTTPGTINIGTYTVRDIRNFGNIDVTTIITKSSNVGAIKLARALDSEAFYDVLRRFGFGSITGSGFPGESPGVLPDYRRWREVEKAALSYGYGLSLTTLQLANAYAGLARGGRMRAPTFVKGGANPEASVIDPALAETILGMLETVTGPNGGAGRASVPYYRVGGKTGTSRKAGGGGYQERHYVSLFAGIAPISAPRLVCAVVINDPSGSVYYGGLVSAPVFGRVIGGALRLMDIPPDSALLMEAARTQAEEIEAAAEEVGGPVPP